MRILEISNTSRVRKFPANGRIVLLKQPSQGIRRRPVKSVTPRYRRRRCCTTALSPRQTSHAQPTTSSPRHRQTVRLIRRRLFLLRFRPSSHPRSAIARRINGFVIQLVIESSRILPVAARTETEPLQFQNGEHYFEKHSGRFASGTEETRQGLEAIVLDSLHRQRSALQVNIGD